MATVNNPGNAYDEENKSGPTTVAGTSSVPTGSGTGNPGVSGGNGISSVKQNAVQNQSGYTDVGSYLNANQAGSEKMGQDVASNLTNKFNQTKEGVQTSANDLINQVNQGYTKENANLVKQASENPNAVADNSDLLSQFQGQLNDSYSGPTDWSDFGTQQGKVNDAQQYGNLAKTPGGYNVYAQELEGPTASQGVNQLDSLLLQGNEGSAQAIKNASDPYSTLNDFLTQQQTGAKGAITAGQNDAQTASQHALDAFTGANGTLTNLNNTITQNTSKALTDAQAGQASIKADLASGNLSDQDLQQLGMTRDQADALLAAKGRAGTSQYMTGHNFGAASKTEDIDLLQALQQQDPTQLINAGTVATPEQYAQMSAIQKLLGDKTPQGAAINPALASLAGTYNPSSLNQYDYQGLTDYANQVADMYRQSAQDEANYLTSQADSSHAASKKKGIANTISHAVTNPLESLQIDPRQALKNFQDTYKNPGTVPGGYDPLPNRQEKDKLGVK